MALRLAGGGTPGGGRVPCGRRDPASREPPPDLLPPPEQPRHVREKSATVPFVRPHPGPGLPRSGPGRLLRRSTAVVPCERRRTGLCGPGTDAPEPGPAPTSDPEGTAPDRPGDVRPDVSQKPRPLSCLAPRPDVRRVGMPAHLQSRVPSSGGLSTVELEGRPAFLSGLGSPSNRARLDLIALLALGAIWRLFWLQATIERDEGAFAYVAWTWLRGGLPYVDAATYAGPVVYVAYAIPMVLIGNTILGIRILNDILFLLSIIVVYRLGSRWWGRSAGVAAVFFYVFFMCLPALEGPLAMSESLLTPFLLFSLWAYQRFVDSRRNLWLAMSALAASLATLTKLSAGFGLLLLLFLVVYASRKEHRSAPSGRSLAASLARRIGVLGGVAAVPAAAVVGYYAAQGSLGALIDIQVRTAGYVAASHYMPPSMYLVLLAEGAPVWLLAGWGVLTARRQKDPGSSIALAWLALMLIPTVLPPSFGHYYLQIGPPASLLAGLGASTLPLWRSHGVASSPSARPSATTEHRAVVFALVIASCALSGPLQAFQYPNMNFDTPVALWHYADSVSYQEQNALARYLASHVRPGDTILVHGWSSEIYWLARIPAPTKDVWSLPSPEIYIPPERYQRIVGLVRSGGARDGVLLPNSREHLFEEGVRDPLTAYLVQDYSQEAHIGNACVLSNTDSTGRTVRFNFALEFASARLLMGQTLNSSVPFDRSTGANLTLVPRSEFLAIGKTPFPSIVQVPLPLAGSPPNRTFVDYRLTMPPNATLKFAAVLASTALSPMPPVTFEVVVRTPDGMTAAVLQASVDPPSTAGSSGPVYL